MGEAADPGRPNGRIGWVERGARGGFHLNHLLVVVDRERLRMYFYRHGHRIWSAPVGVGQPSMPTPTGHFCGPYYDAPGIPGYISHGCIRLHVTDDFWLAEYLKLGTPLHVT